MQEGSDAAVEVTYDTPETSATVSPFATRPLEGTAEETNGMAHHRRSTGVLVVEHTDFHKAKSIWQGKLDETIARKEQDQIIAELQQMKNSEKESERATYQFLRDEGYTVEGNAFKERRDKDDEALARQLAEQQERETKEERATAAGGASAEGGHSRRSSHHTDSQRRHSSGHHECHRPREAAQHGDHRREQVTREADDLRKPIHGREGEQHAHREGHDASGPLFLPAGLFPRDSGHRGSQREQRHSHISTSPAEDAGTDDRKNKKTVVQRLFFTKNR